MIKLFSYSCLILTFVLLLATGSGLKAQQTHQKSKNEIPVVILQAFKQAYPNAMIKASSKETEKGKVVYEIESVDGTLNRDLLYSPDGKVLEIEETIPSATLPMAITQSIAKEYPKSEIKKAEKVTVGEIITYELVVSSANRAYSITLDPNGKILEKEKIGKKEKEEDEEKEE
jgi:hypothetical protein